MNETYQVKHESDYKDLFCSLLKQLEKVKVVLFQGEMGAGKTTFIRYFLHYVGTSDEVSSPTYAIVNTYSSTLGLIHHFDCYRFDSVEEAYDIGMEEYLYSGEVCLIEWPDRVTEILPDRVIIVSLSVQADGSRMVKIVGT